MNKKFDLKRILENPKFVKIAVVSCVAAILLIFLSSFIDFTPKAFVENTTEYEETLKENLLSIFIF